MKNKKILITGCCGFIGYSLSIYFLNKNFIVYGIDKLINNYPLDLKKKRLIKLKKFKNFIFFKKDVKYINKIDKKFENIHTLFHLAAQAGVRDSQKEPINYHLNNVDATYELIKFINNQKINNIFFSSSSSVYGDSVSFKENIISNPLSFYASTKQYNESMFKYFLKNKRIICMRFFSVFGEEGRPDMAVYKFIKSIDLNKKIYLNNNGNDKRDYTYIEDLLDLIYLSYLKMIKKKPFFKILNYGLGNSYSTHELFNTIRNNMNKNFNKIVYTDKNIYDVDLTKSDYSNLLSFLEVNSIKKLKTTKLNIAIKKTIDWYIKNKK